MRIPMMAITTSNSTNVNARHFRRDTSIPFLLPTYGTLETQTVPGDAVAEPLRACKSPLSALQRGSCGPGRVRRDSREESAAVARAGASRVPARPNRSARARRYGRCASAPARVAGSHEREAYLMQMCWPTEKAVHSCCQWPVDPEGGFQQESRAARTDNGVPMTGSGDDERGESGRRLAACGGLHGDPGRQRAPGVLQRGGCRGSSDARRARHRDAAGSVSVPGRQAVQRVPHATSHIHISFDCVPMRCVYRWDVPLDAPPGLPGQCMRLRRAADEHGLHNTYYLYNGRCALRLTNDARVGTLVFCFEGTILTDPRDCTPRPTSVARRGARASWTFPSEPRGARASRHD
jgi:hypothetical protein